MFKFQLYFTLVFLACFLIPGIIIAVCYTLIAVIIWKKSKAIEEGSDAMCSLRDGQGSNLNSLFGMIFLILVVEHFIWLF